jgi:multidrug transporter EmrE-like cation transporter
MARSSPLDFLYIAMPIALTTYGQLVLKWRLMHLPAFPGTPAANLKHVALLLVDPAIFSGLLAAFLASVVWMGALKRFELGFAYPFMSLNFAIVLVLNWWLFDEPLSAQRLLGVALIVAGTAFAARG